MAREITGKVVVITGASSGIGRATALAFARQGANLVLAAREAGPLQQVAAACEAVGAPAIVVPTNVSDEKAVQTLARVAVEAFDRIDVWVNNAAVYMLGKFEQVPSDAFRELYETNVFGTVNGTRAALPHLKQSRGILINVASMAATVGIPFGSAYNSSKWAIRGFSECIRAELKDEGVEVVTVMPASIDTPLFDHAANYSGKTIKPLDPIYAPEDVAKTIVASARRPRPEVMAGGMGYVARVMHTLLPVRVFGRMMAKQVDGHFIDLPAPATAGNLEQPLPPFAIEGGWRAGRLKVLESERDEHRKRKAFAAGAVALALAALPTALALAQRRRRRGLLAAMWG